MRGDERDRLLGKTKCRRVESIAGLCVAHHSPSNNGGRPVLRVDAPSICAAAATAVDWIIIDSLSRLFFSPPRLRSSSHPPTPNTQTHRRKHTSQAKMADTAVEAAPAPMETTTTKAAAEAEGTAPARMQEEAAAETATAASGDAPGQEEGGAEDGDSAGGNGPVEFEPPTVRCAWGFVVRCCCACALGWGLWMSTIPPTHTSSHPQTVERLQDHQARGGRLGAGGERSQGHLHAGRRHLHPLLDRLVGKDKYPKAPSCFCLDASLARLITYTPTYIPKPLTPHDPHSANDFCREGRRTTISANDVYQALRELDFEEFVEPLRAFLASA